MSKFWDSLKPTLEFIKGNWKWLAPSAVVVSVVGLLLWSNFDLGRKIDKLDRLLYEFKYDQALTLATTLEQHPVYLLHLPDIDPTKLDVTKLRFDLSMVTSKDDTQWSRLELRKAMADVGLGRDAEAQALFKQYVKSFTADPDRISWDPEILRILNYEGMSFEEASNYDEALRTFHEVTRRGNQMPTPVQKSVELTACAYYHHGGCELITLELARAAEDFQAAERLYRKLTGVPSMSCLGDVLVSEAVLQEQVSLRNFVAISEAYLPAEAFISGLLPGNPTKAFWALSKSEFQMKEKDWSAAMQTINSVVDDVDAEDPHGKDAFTLHRRLAEIFVQLGEEARANEQLRKCDAIESGFKAETDTDFSPVRRAHLEAARAQVLSHESPPQIRQANLCYQRAIDLLRGSTAPELECLAQIYEGWAGMASDRGDYRTALARLAKAHDSRQGITYKDSEEVANNYIMAGQIAAQYDQKLATEYFEKAHGMCGEHARYPLSPETSEVIEEAQTKYLVRKPPKPEY